MSTGVYLVFPLYKSLFRASSLSFDELLLILQSKRIIDEKTIHHIMKKRSFRLFVLFVLAMVSMGNAEAQNNGMISLSDILQGKYSQKRVRGMMPMADGNYYAVIEGDKVVRYSFATTQAAGIIFDLDKATGEKPKSFSDYVASPDGNHLLIETNHKAIYRRSYTSDFYLYDVKTKEMRPLSLGGSQECVRFSPDGKSLIMSFSDRGNSEIYQYNLKTQEKIKLTKQKVRIRL